MKKYLLVLIPILLISLGQTFSKYGAMIWTHKNNITGFLNLYILLGYFLLILRGFVWIFILKKVNLSFAYSFISISYIFILLIAYFMFKENITSNNIIGSSLIITGIIFISFGEAKINE